MYIICKEEILVEFNFAVGWLIHQTAKFNTAPNFPVIWYATMMKYIIGIVFLVSLVDAHKS